MSKKQRLHLYTTTTITLLLFFLSMNSMAGEYMQSAHGTLVQRPVLAGKYAIGNCAHCHEQHASLEGTEPSPPATGGPDVYLGAGKEEDLCFTCHGTAPVGTAPNIETDITKTYGHLVNNYTDIHLTHESLADISSTPTSNYIHIECTDCHNPHTAKSTGPLYGAKGATPDYTNSPNNWDAPLQDDYTLQTATTQYEVCFRCHSGANSQVTSWGGAGAGGWTDLGLEFNPNNKAYHPITAGTGSHALNANQLLAPWNDVGNIGTQTMYCSDCHESNSGQAGPHGSSIKWMLAGTNKAWPYTQAQYNGTSTGGTFRTLADWGLNAGGVDGLFCFNCHPNSYLTLGINRVHKPGTGSSDVHRLKYCIYCHIRVPHGGKVSRLIAADDNDGVVDMPTRYYSDGIGTTAYVYKFKKEANMADYDKTDCAASCGSGPGDGHTINPGGTETW